MHWGMQDIFTSCFEASAQVSGPGTSSVYRTAWLLFLYAKARLLPAFPDLVSSFNLLLCVMNFLLAHISPQQHCFLPTDAQRYEQSVVPPSDPLQVLLASSGSAAVLPSQILQGNC